MQGPGHEVVHDTADSVDDATSIHKAYTIPSRRWGRTHPTSGWPNRL